MKNELVAQACSVLQHVIAMMKWEMHPKYILYAQTGRKKAINQTISVLGLTLKIVTYKLKLLLWMKSINSVFLGKARGKNIWCNGAPHLWAVQQSFAQQEERWECA